MSNPEQLSATELSYALHRRLEQDPSRYGKMPSSLVAPDTIDAWRHDRMRDSWLPFLRTLPDSKWLTIGDGRFGADANYLHRHDADVVASSLTDHTLQLSHDAGHIDRFQAVNAESMPFDDDAFDFVACKEAYHHLPRPPIGFYEMFRVAKYAVILTEPIDHRSGGILLKLKGLAKRVLRGEDLVDFEPDGNYLYRTKPEEIGKLLLAMNYRHYAVWRFNDFFVPSLASKNSRRFGLGSIATRAGILIQDVLCKSGLLGYGLGTIVAFKSDLDSELRENLEDFGFQIVDLPENPYLTTDD